MDPLAPQTAPVEQACVCPYRYRDGSLEICLITSSNGRRWGFPKGTIEPGETLEQAAMKEAREEAGLIGSLHDEPLGSFRYEKSGRKLSVTVLLMHVSEATETWAESHLRQRRWVTPEQGEQLLDRPELNALLWRAVNQLRPV